VRGMKIEAV